MTNKGKKIVIIGAISAGTSTAAKIRRKSENAEIVIYLTLEIS
jgi:NADPH-dependent 2,4-dienoyl-CoA reductase/sulfur reductase-like enzyme